MKMPSLPLDVPIDGWVLQSWLGEGAMGVVYRAFHEASERTVALKLMGIPTEADGEQAIGRFHREAALLSRFAHPHIVGYVDSGTLQAFPFLAMAYLPGLATLDQAWAEKADESWLLTRIEEALSGLEAMHAPPNPVMHRDLKPVNLGIPDDGMLRILDLGLARGEVDTELTKAGTVLGTIIYMAPEQLLGGAVDHRTDLYAIGMILLALLGGGHPLRGRNVGDVALAVAMNDIYDTPQPVPAHLDAFVRKLTALDADDRFPSAAAARTALQALRGASQPVLAELQQSLSVARSALHPRLSGIREALARPLRGRTVGTIAPPATFVGRTELLASVQQALLDATHRVVLLCGRGGIGKSAVAARIASEVEATYTLGAVKLDGIVALSLREPDQRSLDALQTLLLQTMADPTALQSAWQEAGSLRGKLDALFIHAFSKGAWLLVLENVEEILDENNQVQADLGAFIERFMASNVRSRILATSRRALMLSEVVEGTHGAARVELPVDAGLAEAEAVALLRALDADGRLHIKDADDVTLTAMVSRTHGMPRTLESLVGSLRTRRTLTLAKLVADVAALDRLAENPARELYDGLRPEEQRVMQALALFERPVPDAALRFILPDEPVDELLELLVRNYVVQFSDDLFGLSPLDAQFARQQIAEAEASPMHVRAAEFFHALRTPRPSWKSLQDVGPQLAEVRHLTAAGRYDQACVVLGEVDRDWLTPQGYAALVIQMRSQLQGKLRDANLHQENDARLGAHLAKLGRLEEALPHIRAALETARARGDRVGCMEMTGHLGVVLGQLGQGDAAIETLQDAARQAAALGKADNEIRYLSYASARLAHRGRFSEAHDAAEAALSRSRTVGDPMALVDALTTAGHLAFQRGQLKRACELQREALQLHQGDALWRVALQLHLGQTLGLLGLVDEAEAMLKEARGVCQALEAPFWDYFCLSVLTMIGVLQLRLDEALLYQEQSDALGATLTWSADLASCSADRAEAMYAAGRFEEALRADEVVMSATQQSDDPCDNADALARSALILASLGRSAEARDSATKGLGIVRHLDSPRTLARCLMAVGVAEWASGEREAARHALEEAVGVADGTEDAWLVGQCRVTRAWVLIVDGQREKAGALLAVVVNNAVPMAAALAVMSHRLIVDADAAASPMLGGASPPYALRVLQAAVVGRCGDAAAAQAILQGSQPQGLLGDLVRAVAPDLSSTGPATRS